MKGARIEQFFRRCGPPWRWFCFSALGAIPIAAGLVAGESLVAAFIAMACTLVGFLAVR